MENKIKDQVGENVKPAKKRKTSKSEAKMIEKVEIATKKEVKKFTALQAAITRGYSQNYIFVVKKKFDSLEKNELDVWFKLFKEIGIE